MRCRGCGGSWLATVFAMDAMPLAGSFAPTKRAALEATRYPLEWRRCLCGLVNVWPDIPDEDIYSAYSYHASDVPGLVFHHREFASWLRDRFEPHLHVEIGGNDGVLTKHLTWPTINVDPSDAWVGPGDNEPFTSALASRLPPADLVTSSNAFAHFSGIGDALDGVRLLLRPGGAFVMEVHDLGATLASKQWDTVYHEHKVEWSEASLREVGALHGLRLEHVWRLPLHGGLLRALFRPDSSKATDAPRREDFIGLQTAYDEAATPRMPRGSVAYGAAARATVYLDHVRPNVARVIDASPRRIGRWVPRVGLRIDPPERMGDPPAVLITAWNHAEDIMSRHPHYRGRWERTWQT